ncbi:MAG: HAD-IA family hydrolase [Myxococcales bacterium]|nr:MAG: HAD-IA family hydrolase [Myxococcales bacterium]
MLVAFDLDGTLEDSRSDMTEAVRRVRRMFALPAISNDAIRPHLSKGMQHLYLYCFAEIADTAHEFEKAKLAYLTDYSEHIATQTHLYSGIETSLNQLHKRYTLAVVTNKPEAISRQLLQTLGVLHLFDAVVGGDTCPHSKPHPEPLIHAAKLCGIDRLQNKVVMIGDSEGDVSMARQAEAKSIWCAWGYAQNPGERQPDAIAQKPSELPALVTQLLG